MEQIEAEHCRSIVMEYLLHYCYKNSAKALLKEMSNLDNCSNMQSTQDDTIQSQSLLVEKSIEWESIDARKDIHDAIRRGDIGKAFTLMEQHFPALIRTYNTLNRQEIKQADSLPRLHHILYKLRCQQFIETLRTSGDLQAIQFAQYYLRPCHKLYSDLTNSVTTLIAYTELENENTMHLLSQERRNIMADEVNEIVLESQHFSQLTTLEKLWRQKTAVQVELDIQKRKESSKDEKETDGIEKIPM